MSDHPEPSWTFVLVPGAGGQAWYWHRVVAELEQRGHLAVAVDLPADDPEAGLQAYADVIVAAAQGHDRVVIVAQSMGALSATLAADRLPADLLVLVNAMIPLAGETGGQWWAMTGQAQARAELAAEQGRSAPDQVDLLEDFFHDVPANVTAAAMEAGEPDQSERPFADPFPLRAWPDVPTRIVSGRDDRFFPLDFQRRVAQERLGTTPDVVPGGHLVALSEPVPLVDRLESYLDDVVAHGRPTPDGHGAAGRPPTPADDDRIHGLEEALWDGQTRFDRAWMDQVLHGDYVEFGHSGRTWDRAAVLDVEPAPIGAELPLEDYRVHHVAPNVALATYTVTDTFGDGGTTRRAKRSSLWVRTPDGWKLRFHQATPAHPDGA